MTGRAGFQSPSLTDVPELRVCGHGLNTAVHQSGMSVNVSGVIDDRSTVRTAAHQHAAVQPQPQSSQLAVTLVKQQQQSERYVSSDTTLHGLFGLMICTALAVLAPELSVNMIYALVVCVSCSPLCCTSNG